MLKLGRNLHWYARERHAAFPYKHFSPTVIWPRLPQLLSKLPSGLFELLYQLVATWLPLAVDVDNLGMIWVISGRGEGFVLYLWKASVEIFRLPDRAVGCQDLDWNVTGCWSFGHQGSLSSDTSLSRWSEFTPLGACRQVRTPISRWKLIGTLT